MTSASSTTKSQHRLIIAAGWAAIAWGVFQLAATRRESLGYWTSVVAINALPSLLLGWATLRRYTAAAVVLGLYGVFRLYIAARVMTQRLDDPTGQPADWWVAPLAVPFAIMWIAGAAAAVAAWRRRAALPSDAR
jgi:hypothetical protein